MEEKTDFKYKKRTFLSAQIDLSKFNKKDFEKATDEEKKQQDVMGESRTFLQDGLRRLRKNPLAMMSIFILLAIVVIIIVAPMICPYSYDTIIRVNGQRDRGIANLGMMEYSEMELQYMEETGEKLFPHISGQTPLGVITLSAAYTGREYLFPSVLLLPSWSSSSVSSMVRSPVTSAERPI